MGDRAADQDTGAGFDVGEGCDGTGSELGEMCSEELDGVHIGGDAGGEGVGGGDLEGGHPGQGGGVESDRDTGDVAGAVAGGAAGRPERLSAVLADVCERSGRRERFELGLGERDAPADVADVGETARSTVPARPSPHT